MAVNFHRRVEYLILCTSARDAGHGTFDTERLGLSSLKGDEFPAEAEFTLVGKIHWIDDDVNQHRALGAAVYNTVNGEPTDFVNSENSGYTMLVTIEVDRNGKPKPLMFAMPLAAEFPSPGEYAVAFLNEGLTIGWVPLRVEGPQ